MPQTDAVAAFVHKGLKPPQGYPLLPQSHHRALADLMSSGIVRGTSNETTVQLLGSGKRRLVVIGLGNRDEFSVECLREAGAALSRAARKHRIKRIAVFPPAIPDSIPPNPGNTSQHIDATRAVGALAEGFVIGAFEYGEYHGKQRKSKDDEGASRLDATLIVKPEQRKGARAAIGRARVMAEAQNFARTIASRPGNDINPPSLAKVAQELARDVGLSCRVLDDRELKRMGMGGILGVGQGSINTPPRMIVLEHRRPGKPLLVIGKSITFDSGGISIKPAEKMGRMIFDKSGGMAVLGLMYAVAKLKLPVRVVGILAAAENILSESSYRPGDILRMYNGVTVEVTNTDAEGRLVLGDALAWGIESYKPAAVVDLATLTGGVVVALGKTMAGIMGNSDELVSELTQAGQIAGEKMWRLPIWEEHRKMLKSDSADIVNSAGGRDASPLQGGAFLSYFVGWKENNASPHTSWAHLDIAGVADTEKEHPLYARGSTGWGVRTMVEWVASRAGR